MKTKLKSLCLNRHPVPFKCIITPRSPAAESLVRESVNKDYWDDCAVCVIVHQHPSSSNTSDVFVTSEVSTRSFGDLHSQYLIHLFLFTLVELVVPYLICKTSKKFISHRILCVRSLNPASSQKAFKKSYGIFFPLAERSVIWVETNVWMPHAHCGFWLYQRIHSASSQIPHYVHNITSCQWSKQRPSKTTNAPVQPTGCILSQGARLEVWAIAPHGKCESGS